MIGHRAATSAGRGRRAAAAASSCPSPKRRRSRRARPRRPRARRLCSTSTRVSPCWKCLTRSLQASTGLGGHRSILVGSSFRCVRINRGAALARAACAPRATMDRASTGSTARRRSPLIFSTSGHCDRRRQVAHEVDLGVQELRAEHGLETMHQRFEIDRDQHAEQHAAPACRSRRSPFPAS